MNKTKINFNEIISDALTLFQEYLNQFQQGLSINSLTDKDFNLLQERETPLNWSYIITNKYNPNDAFDFGITWELNKNLVGAFISSYKLSDRNLEIYAIERFDHSPLDGKMFINALYVSYLVLMLTNGKGLKLVDVEKHNTKLRYFYKSYGFTELNNSDFYLSFDDLETLVTTQTLGG